MYAREKVGLDAGLARPPGQLLPVPLPGRHQGRPLRHRRVAAGDRAGEERHARQGGSPRSFEIFRREREEGVQPVLKEDVAEVLRRRFFEPESIRDREAFRPHVVAAVANIADHDETVAEGRQDRRGAVPQELSRSTRT